MLLYAEKIEKSIADRLLFSIEKLQILDGDRIGLIGDNGSGKTTLLNILAGDEQPDKGLVARHCEIGYIRQFAGDQAIPWGRLASEFRLPKGQNCGQCSGGEAAKARIVNALAAGRLLLLADEPTSNLDAESVELFYEKFRQSQSFVLVSHDRALLDRLCNRIWELRGETLREYAGNYSAYLACRETEEKATLREYEQYVSEKARLQAVALEKRRTAASVVKKPGNSGKQMVGRFASRSKDGQQKALQRQAKSVEKHIGMLETKEKPKAPPAPRMDFRRTNPPENKIILRAERLTFAYDSARPVLSDASFMIENRERTALLGPKGCGKTTLLNLLYRGNDAVTRAPKVRFGYFRQGFDQLNGAETVLESALSHSVQPVHIVRTVLSRMLFLSRDLQKPVSVLSSGEKVRLALAQIFLSDANVLLLDEPYNSLDIQSLQALEALLLGYEGAVIFASHDGRFVDTIATRRAVLAGGKVRVLPSLRIR